MEGVERVPVTVEGGEHSLRAEVLIILCKHACYIGHKSCKFLGISIVLLQNIFGEVRGVLHHFGFEITNQKNKIEQASLAFHRSFYFRWVGCLRAVGIHHNTQVE